MGKTIIITEKQFKNILEGDSSYLSSIDNDTDVPRGHTEVVANGGTLDSTHSDGKPVTTNNISAKKVKNPSWGNNGITRGVPLTCSKKKTALTEENSLEDSRYWRIPDDIHKVIGQNIQNYSGDKNSAGWDRVNFLYNNPNLTTKEVKRLVNFFDTDGKTDKAYYDLVYGEKLEPFVRNTYNSFKGLSNTGKEFTNKNVDTPNVYHDMNRTNSHGNNKSMTTTFNGEVSTF